MLFAWGSCTVGSSGQSDGTSFLLPLSFVPLSSFATLYLLFDVFFAWNSTPLQLVQPHENTFKPLNCRLINDQSGKFAGFDTKAVHLRLFYGAQNIRTSKCTQNIRGIYTVSVPQVSLSTGCCGDHKAPLIDLFPHISAAPVIDSQFFGQIQHFPGPQGPSSTSTLALIVDFIAMNLKLLNWLSSMWILWHTVCWYALICGPFQTSQGF